jgi:AAA family ATP:ADP antiporter
VPLGRDNLLLVAAVLLEVAVYCVYRLERTAGPSRQDDRANQRIGGGAFAAFTEVLRSPYLLGIAAWVSLLSFGATILYFAQANLVSTSVEGAGAQTRLFASVDLAVSVLTSNPGCRNRRLEALARRRRGAYRRYTSSVLRCFTGAHLRSLVFQVVQRWQFATNPARQIFHRRRSRGEIRRRT